MEVKPCPFCGCAPLVKYEEPDGGRVSYTVKCGNPVCGADLGWGVSFQHRDLNAGRS